MGNGTGVRVDGVPSICFGSVNLSGDCTVHSSTFSTHPFFIYLFLFSVFREGFRFIMGGSLGVSFPYFLVSISILLHHPSINFLIASSINFFFSPPHFGNFFVLFDCCV